MLPAMQQCTPSAALSASCTDRGLRTTLFELVTPIRPELSLALPFAEQVRRVMIRNRISTSHSEVITGKRKDGTPLDGHSHAHYLPTDEDHDGFIDHITIYAPRGFDNADMQALRSLKTIFRSSNRPDIYLRLIELNNLTHPYSSRSDGMTIAGGFNPRSTPMSQPRRVATTELGQQTNSCSDHAEPNICSLTPSIFREARRWRSVTPFSLPRFPNRGGGKPPRPRDLPEGQLRRELRLRGLPEPVSIKPLSGYTVSGKQMIPWTEFHTTRHNGTRGNGLAGFEIEFERPVRGPISLGFACHFGLGLFLPADDATGSSGAKYL